MQAGAGMSVSSGLVLSAPVGGVDPCPNGGTHQIRGWVTPLHLELARRHEVASAELGWCVGVEESATGAGRIHVPNVVGTS